MADYSKLTVVKLKEELKNRYLPQTGLKASLIARLTEHDAQTEAVTEVENNHVDQESEVFKASAVLSNGDNIEDSSLRNDAIVPSDINQGREESGVQDPSLVADQDVQSVEEDRAKEEDTRQDTSSSDKVQNGIIPMEHNVPTKQNTPKIVEEFPQTEETTTTEPADLMSSSKPMPDETKVEAGMETSQATTIENETPAASTQTSLNKEELMEDTRKRKRRSRSPPLSSIDGVFKKVKALDGTPKVRLPEDVVEGMRHEDTSSMQTSHTASEFDSRLNGNLSKDEEIQSSGYEESKTKDDSSTAQGSAVHDNVTVDSMPAQETDQITSPELPDAILSLSKISPTDTRFKNLFSPPSKPSDAPPNIYPETEDRTISPALHPATSALYIRNFMRPLHPTHLKDHLAFLAKPASAPSADEQISDFFLDSIRTHSLVRFSSVSAASRVRSALHDRVWPDETPRKPLWVDFVPEEKLQKWISVEQNAASSRGTGAKRWEVVYERENGTASAYLQETDLGNNSTNHKGINTGPSRTSVATADHPNSTSLAPPNAPLGPRISPSTSTGKNFQALDDLFLGTVAKPKLYYLPVAPGISERRLAKLRGLRGGREGGRGGRGGARGDEMRRYTFDREEFVDNGGEFGSGRGGGYRGRGGGGAGGGGRGPGWGGRR